ncbi:MAG TPA: AbrB/MazE/SpoVT family DNA-binding domain-containing protein [Chloroflexota bacterium]|jgi:AbrB family looped-hinge helix DNA binding protein|nr:AbrB/MazE/SpoVT family DNA-binding domain-containing protein [Chloroflexota bacterium]
MATATVTSKGQITLPKSVRDELGVITGDQVVFVMEGKGVSLHAVPRGSLSALRGVAKGRRAYPGRPAERNAARDEAARNAAGGRRPTRGS